MDDFSQDAPCSADSLEAIDAICNEFEAAWRNGEQPRIEDYLARGPDNLREKLFAALLKCEVQLLEGDEQKAVQNNYIDRFPDFAHIIRDHFGRHQATHDTSHGDADESAGECIEHSDEVVPASIGRFQVRELLGTGAFGRVYLAYDDQLDQLRSIKVPHRQVPLPCRQCCMMRALRL